MSFFNRHGRALLFAAVVTVGAVCVVGAAEKPSAFTDSRDGRKYRAVEIGGKTWMAENLNYQAGNSWCFENDNSNCEKYGRLYDWKTAITVCPSGWHLPSRAEWEQLITTAGGFWKAGGKLKTASGWYNNGNGTDEFGFSALPGGLRFTDGSFYFAGNNGFWWTATEKVGDGAYFRSMFCYGGYVTESNYGLSGGLSVRCLGD